MYSILVPAGGSLEVTATPLDAAFDLSLYAIQGPAQSCQTLPSSCAAGADDAGAGANESIGLDNISGSDETFFVIVDGFDGGGPFELSIAVTL